MSHSAVNEDPVLNIYDCDLKFFSEVVPIIRSILMTGRSVYLDGDSGWLMAVGDPGEPDWELIRHLDSMKPLSFQNLTLVEGYRV